LPISPFCRYSHNLLEYLADPPAFAHEVARVLSPRGQAVVAHWDWDTQVFAGHDKARIRRLVSAFAGLAGTVYGITGYAYVGRRAAG
jgi:hypothetical protein